jgi:hypothetical protein
MPVHAALAPLTKLEPVAENENGALPAGKPGAVKVPRLVVSLWKWARPGCAVLFCGETGVVSTSMKSNPVNAAPELLVMFSFSVIRSPKRSAWAAVAAAFSTNESVIGADVAHVKFKESEPSLRAPVALGEAPGENAKLVT